MSPDQVPFFPADALVIDPAQATQLVMWVALAAVVLVALASVLERTRGLFDTGE
jgi:hypothetical protein